MTRLVQSDVPADEIGINCTSKCGPPFVLAHDGGRYWLTGRPAPVRPGRVSASGFA